MKIYIEKKDEVKMASHYFTIEVFNSKYSIETNAAKSILLLWVFFGIVFLAYMAGKEIAYNEQMLNIYLVQGRLTTPNGTQIFCEPFLSKSGKLAWNCTEAVNQSNG